MVRGGFYVVRSVGIGIDATAAFAAAAAEHVFVVDQFFYSSGKVNVGVQLEKLGVYGLGLGCLAGRRESGWGEE